MQLFQNSKEATARFVAALVLLLLFPVVSLKGDFSDTVLGPSAYPVVLEHNYDSVSDTVVSWTLKPGDIIGQSFVVPADCERLDGFRVKLLRTGLVPPLRYRIGSSWGSGDVSAGEIQPDQVTLFFERWTGKDFRAPAPVKGGQRYYLQLQVSEGAAAGQYEFFGTASAILNHPALNLRHTMISQWGEGTFDPATSENPINLDYGAHTPRYDAGTAVSATGQELSQIDFSFQFSSKKAVRQDRLPLEEEERFAFVQDQLLAPVHSKSLRVPNGPARKADEIEITRNWSLIGPQSAGIVLETALADFVKFMANAMEVPIRAQTHAPLASALGSTSVVIAGTRAELPAFGSDLTRSEAFAVDVSDQRIVVCGFDERGVMRGLHHLEDLMSFRRAPLLQVNRETRAPLYSPRLTTTPFHGGVRQLEMVTDPYTDTFLSRISHLGFNAIFVGIDLHKIGKSKVYPELNENVELHQKRLRDIGQRAEKYGLDTYLVLYYYPPPASFFSRHPETRGTPFKGYGPGGSVLCTSHPEVQKHIEQATADVFRRVPDVHGVVFIVGGEGFIHCYTRAVECPRCARSSAQDVVAELATVISRGARTVRPDAVAALWPYSAGWSREDKTQSKLIDKLPKEITFMTEFGKEGLVTFGGKTIPAYDYPISYLGPSERFVEQARLAKSHGLPLWVKTEHAIALEAVQTPYIPVLHRWAERFRRISQFDNITGFFANWEHYGFTPSIAAEVAKWHTWSPLPDTRTLLGAIATREFGPGTEEPALEAWRLWSEAIAHYPFSGSVAMGPVQKGPAHPLFLDPEYQPRHQGARRFKNDLSWTQPWGVDLVIEQFEKLVNDWQKGVKAWEGVTAAAHPSLRDRARREGGIGQALLSCFRSTLNVARFYKLRDELGQEKDTSRRLELLDALENVARSELENARNVLPVVSADSRLGYANAGSSTGVPRGGIYSPDSIRKKIAQVERLLNEDIPERRSR
jgi:hypothetical protein